MFVSSQNGHTDIAQLLIDEGADIDAMTSKEATPLIIASLQGHSSIVQLLLRKGAQVNPKNHDGSVEHCKSFFSFRLIKFCSHFNIFIEISLEGTFTFTE